MTNKNQFKEFRNSSHLTLLSSESKKIIARDAMIKPVFLRVNDDSKKIIKKLKREDTNVCIVVTKDKKFVGEISDEDMINFFVDQINNEPLTTKLNVGYRREFMYKTAKELINSHKSTVDIDTPINKVIKLIHTEGFHYIPVLNKDKKVVGVVTPSSVLKLLQED